MSEYPESWAEGLRVAICKGGDSIRPITIEPIFGKIFEIFLTTRSPMKLLVDQTCVMFFFVTGSQTQDNVLILSGCIEKQLYLNNNPFIAMADFRQVFNFVNRSILFHKLIKSGFTGELITVLCDKIQDSRFNKLY